MRTFANYDKIVFVDVFGDMFNKDLLKLPKL
jgi:hypothetical protein